MSALVLGRTLLAPRIGAIEANQIRDREIFRNDRLIGAVVTSARFTHLKSFGEPAPHSSSSISGKLGSVRIVSKWLV